MSISEFAGVLSNAWNFLANDIQVFGLGVVWWFVIALVVGLIIKFIKGTKNG